MRNGGEHAPGSLLETGGFLSLLKVKLLYHSLSPLSSRTGLDKTTVNVLHCGQVLAGAQRSCSCPLTVTPAGTGITSPAGAPAPDRPPSEPSATLSGRFDERKKTKRGLTGPSCELWRREVTQQHWEDHSNRSARRTNSAPSGALSACMPAAPGTGRLRRHVAAAYRRADSLEGGRHGGSLLHQLGHQRQRTDTEGLQRG
jgi:hypothetical protein